MAKRNLTNWRLLGRAPRATAHAMPLGSGYSFQVRTAHVPSLADFPLLSLTRELSFVQEYVTHLGHHVIAHRVEKRVDISKHSEQTKHIQSD